MKPVSSPEVSRVGVVVPVDVGDDHGEPDDAGSLRVFVGSPGHAEGRPLLDTDRPAATERPHSEGQGRINLLLGPPGAKKQSVGPPAGPLLFPYLVSMLHYPRISRTMSSRY